MQDTVKAVLSPVQVPVLLLPGDLAHSVERSVRNAEVEGSSPSVSTIAGWTNGKSLGSYPKESSFESRASNHSGMDKRQVGRLIT